MSFLPSPSDVQYDDTIDTRLIAPEDDFASPADPSIPRRGPQNFGAVGTDSYYGAPPAQAPQNFDPAWSSDFSAQAFQNNGRIQPTFAQPRIEDHPYRPQPIEYVGEIPDTPFGYDDLSGNQPIVQPGEGEHEGFQEEEWPAELLNAADLSLEDARQSFSSVEDLQAAVRQLDSRTIVMGRDAIARQQLQMQSTPTSAPAEDDWTLPERENGWDDDTRAVADTLTGKFKEMLSKRDEQIRQQQEFMQQYVQDQQRENNLRELREFDEMVNSLPDEYIPHLGRGYAADYNPKSMIFQNRLFLEQSMKALQEGQRLSGRAPIPKEELMIRALGVAFPNIQQQQMRESVMDEFQQQQSMMTRRPTRRMPPAVTKFEAAVQAADAWYDQTNMGQQDLETYGYGTHPQDQYI